MTIILTIIILIVIIFLILFTFLEYYKMKFSLHDLHESQWKEIKQKVWNETDNIVDFGKFSHEKYVKVAGTLYENKKMQAVDKAYENYVDNLLNMKFLFIFDMGKNIPHKGRYPDD